VQHAGFTHEILADLMGSRDVGQLLIEHAGERQQVVALVLQCDAQRANAPHIFGFALCQFLNDKVEQLLPRGQRRAGQCQDVMAQPLGERSDVARQPIRLGLGLSRLFQLDSKRFVWAALAGAVDPVVQLLAP
jgi:hypothetical protein